MINFQNSLQFVAKINATFDVPEIACAMADLAKRFGFTSVFGGIVPNEKISPSHAAIEPLVMVKHFPDAWGQRYNAQNYLFRDPVLLRLRQTTSAFTWNESYATCLNTEDARTIGGEAAEFGLKDGYVVPVSTLDPSRAAVSFGGARDKLDPQEALALGFAASFAIGHFLRLRSPHRSSPTQVTARELDCLLWASEGKTDWEISVILGISRSTVTKHIASARAKLGAVNKSHAVAIAIRTRMVE